MPAQVAVAPPSEVSASVPIFRKILPRATVVLALGLTVVWAGLLGYGLMKLLELAL